MHDNSPAQDFGLGLIICAGLVIAFLVAILFYGAVLLTVACVVSTAIWVTACLWKAGRGIPQFRGEVIVLGGIAIVCSFLLAGGLGSWAFELNWSHRPVLMTFPRYLQFVVFNTSLVVLVLRARSRGLNDRLLAPLAATLTKMAIRAALGFTLLAVLATRATFLHEGLLFLTCLAPLVFARSTISLVEPTKIQNAC